MFKLFINLNPITQTLIASTLTLLATILGSSIVFLFKKANKTLMDFLLAISAGIMLSSAIFSLLIPAIDQAKEMNVNTSFVISTSILLGALLLIIGNKITKHEHKNIMMLITSITLHNIPEGAAIGVAFAAASSNIDNVTITSAIALAIAIGIQNFPEGAAISIPLRREGLSRFKSFILGSLSGVVEPISAIIGAILVLKIQIILPFLLAFAAGSMLFVVIEELIPESQTNKHKNIITYLTLIGFIIMLLLEI